MNNQLFNAGFVRTCFKAVALAAGLLMHFQVHALAVVDAKLEELADQARVTLFFDQDFDGKLGLFRIANPARQVLDFPVELGTARYPWLFPRAAESKRPS